MMQVFDIEQMYVVQGSMVHGLASKEVIVPEDLAALNRIGKCLLIDIAWSRCRDDTKRMLLMDAHHFVRSCAVMAG